MLLYQAGLPLSSSTLNRVACLVRARRRVVGSRWRVLTPGRQALLTLVYLHTGTTYASAAAGFGVSTATAARRIQETIDLLAARRAPLRVALRRARKRGIMTVILDGTVIRCDRVTARPGMYSGKHRHHGVNVQVVTDLDGNALWISPDLPGSTHDTAAARIWMIHQHLDTAGMTALADKGYHGLHPTTIHTPHKGRGLSPVRQHANHTHATIRSRAERAFAELKKWRILHKLRCSTHRATPIIHAIHTLNTYQQTG